MITYWLVRVENCLTFLLLPLAYHIHFINLYNFILLVYFRSYSHPSWNPCHHFFFSLCILTIIKQMKSFLNSESKHVCPFCLLECLSGMLWEWEHLVWCLAHSRWSKGMCVIIISLLTSKSYFLEECKVISYDSYISLSFHFLPRPNKKGLQTQRRSQKNECLLWTLNWVIQLPSTIFFFHSSNLRFSRWLDYFDFPNVILQKQFLSRRED